MYGNAGQTAQFAKRRRSQPRAGDGALGLGNVAETAERAAPVVAVLSSGS